MIHTARGGVSLATKSASDVAAMLLCLLDERRVSIEHGDSMPALTQPCHHVHAHFA
jgi:hypothetical protein